MPRPRPPAPCPAPPHPQPPPPAPCPPPAPRPEPGTPSPRTPPLPRPRTPPLPRPRSHCPASLDRSFEAEINYNNPLGTGGRLAIGFAVLLRALWKGTHHAFQPSKLKVTGRAALCGGGRPVQASARPVLSRPLFQAIVASKASQFTGYAQHDAQEFMAFLLDGLHEDLNRIQNKPYTETVDSDGRPDEVGGAEGRGRGGGWARTAAARLGSPLRPQVVAEEAWQRHKMRNDSFIVDLFQGQYKSKLVCPACAKVRPPGRRAAGQPGGPLRRGLEAAGRLPGCGVGGPGWAGPRVPGGSGSPGGPRPVQGSGFGGCSA